MNKGWIVIAIVAVLALLLVGCPFITYANTEVRLRQSVLAQQKKNEAVFDRVWKTISQQAEVSDRYAVQFKDIYIGMMSERYTDGEARLAKFVQETSPVYSPDLMKTLMVTIEASRRDFEREQSSLIDKKREHDVLLQSIPSGIYLSILGRKAIEITVVTSSKTEESFKSGKDDDTKLYDKK